MRDPKRIKPFLEKLEQIWNKFPDMRFGQFIENVSHLKKQELYFLEEEQLLELFENFYCAKDSNNSK